jgi:hypothetical protein
MEGRDDATNDEPAEDRRLAERIRSDEIDDGAEDRDEVEQPAP